MLAPDEIWTSRRSAELQGRSVSHYRWHRGAGYRERSTHEEKNTMTKDREVVAGRWRIVETEVWGPDALDLVVPAYIIFDRSGLGEMQLIAICASIDYRVEKRPDGPVVEFSWCGFDDGDPTSGRASARVDGDTMRGRLFIHQGDDSTFVARREPGGKERSGSNEPLQPPATARPGRVPARRGVRRGRG